MSKQALIVDDSRSASSALADLLTLLDFEATIANGSRDAVEKLASLTPDLIILDVNMPGVTGLEVAAFVRREPRTAHVPIIIVSGATQPVSVVRQIREGGYKFLAKPVTSEALEEALKEVMG